MRRTVVALAALAVACTSAVVQQAPDRTAELSQTEARAIVDNVRRCWSTDPGLLGLDTMVLPMQAYLSASGVIMAVYDHPG
jgi:hypothetical protein